MRFRSGRFRNGRLTAWTSVPSGWSTVPGTPTPDAGNIATAAAELPSPSRRSGPTMRFASTIRSHVPRRRRPCRPAATRPPRIFVPPSRCRSRKPRRDHSDVRRPGARLGQAGRRGVLAAPSWRRLGPRDAARREPRMALRPRPGRTIARRSTRVDRVTPRRRRTGREPTAVAPPAADRVRARGTQLRYADARSRQALPPRPRGSYRRRPRRPPPRGAAPATRTSPAGVAGSAVPIASTSDDERRIALRVALAAQAEALEGRRQRREEVATAARVHERGVTMVLAERDRDPVAERDHLPGHALREAGRTARRPSLVPVPWPLYRRTGPRS